MRISIGVVKLDSWIRIFTYYFDYSDIKLNDPTIRVKLVVRVYLSVGASGWVPMDDYECQHEYKVFILSLL